MRNKYILTIYTRDEVESDKSLDEMMDVFHQSGFELKDLAQLKAKGEIEIFGKAYGRGLDMKSKTVITFKKVWVDDKQMKLMMN